MAKNNYCHRKETSVTKNSRLSQHPHTGGLQTRHCNSYSSQPSTHIAEASWKLLKLSPHAQICPWQRCCFPGSALKTQLSVFLPSTLQISDDLEQRVQAVTITKLPDQEDEPKGKGGRHQQQPRAALAPVPSTANAVRDTMTAVPPSPGHRVPQSPIRGCQELLSQSARSHMSLVTSDTGAPTLENSGAEHTRQQPQKQLLCQCNPATGQLQPQDTFLLQLCTYKAPKKQTLWFVQTEMWHLLGKELGCNHAKASAHSSFLKKTS